MVSTNGTVGQVHPVTSLAALVYLEVKVGDGQPDLSPCTDPRRRAAVHLVLFICSKMVQLTGDTSRQFSRIYDRTSVVCLMQAVERNFLLVASLLLTLVEQPRQTEDYL